MWNFILSMLKNGIMQNVQKESARSGGNLGAVMGAAKGISGAFGKNPNVATAFSKAKEIGMPRGELRASLPDVGMSSASIGEPALKQAFAQRMQSLPQAQSVSPVQSMQKEPGFLAGMREGALGMPQTGGYADEAGKYTGRDTAYYAGKLIPQIIMSRLGVNQPAEEKRGQQIIQSHKKQDKITDETLKAYREMRNKQLALKQGLLEGTIDPSGWTKDQRIAAGLESRVNQGIDIPPATAMKMLGDEFADYSPEQKSYLESRVGMLLNQGQQVPQVQMQQPIQQQSGINEDLINAYMKQYPDRTREEIIRAISRKR